MHFAMCMMMNNYNYLKLKQKKKQIIADLELLIGVMSGYSYIWNQIIRGGI